MRRVRYARRLGAVGVVAVVTLVLAQNTTSASFTGTTGNAGNSVTAAASFCGSSAGGTTLYASEDTTGYQSNPTLNYGTNTQVGTVSASTANARVFLRFPLAGVLPAHCVLTGATLRLYANPPAASRTIDAYRVDPTAPVWTETGLDWSNMPAPTGTAVSSASLASAGWQQWSVLSMATAMVSGVNSGFFVRDSVDNASPSKSNLYDSRETTTPANKPQLVLTWG